MKLSSSEIQENYIDFGPLFPYLQNRDAKDELSSKQISALKTVEAYFALGSSLIAVCLVKEIVIYDLTTKEIVGNFNYLYTNVDEKINEKFEMKKLK